MVLKFSQKSDSVAKTAVFPKIRYIAQDIPNYGKKDKIVPIFCATDINESY